jgi:hypothetical protein
MGFEFKGKNFAAKQWKRALQQNGSAEPDQFIPA